MKIKKICLITTAQYNIEVFLLDQIRQLSGIYDVTLLVKTDDPDFLLKRGISVTVVCAPIERKINLLKDLYTLIFLIRFFCANSFDLIHSVSPKAGLLAMLAGLVAAVPVRIHTFTGQVWGSREGVMQWILKTADRITSWAATHILTDSFTQRDFLIQEHVVSEAKSNVLANGSISGVDLERFRPDEKLRIEVRQIFYIPAHELVFLFMARLTRDKGALVMAEGFARFVQEGGDGHLIVVGPDEEQLRPRMRELFGESLAKVHFEDYTRLPEKFMAAADIFCLPSYREGFGTVLINAAAVGIPAIVSRIYGSEEAVQENVTGLLIEAGNSLELAEKMLLLARDPDLRAQLGLNAQERAHDAFSESTVTAAILEFYAGVMSTVHRS
ncbi:glycosyltransferase [bacterium]|nr:glycosyltransferase [bacterium]